MAREGCVLNLTRDSERGDDYNTDPFPPTMASTSDPPLGLKSGEVPSKLDIAERDVTVSRVNPSQGRLHPLLYQAVRASLFFVWFNIACVAIVITQFLGVPLALYDKNLFYV